MEVFVVGLILALILYPIRLRKKGIRLRKIIFREGEILAWVYVWFYLAWGLNYYRDNIYIRLQTPPIAYEEAHFKSFLTDYTARLNATYQAETKIDAQTLRNEIGAFYTNLSSVYGLTKPQSWQTPKEFIFTPIYSKVSVLGSMGPFFSEAQLNADLPEVQYPFTYAHEFSHLLGVSNEAEANYWAYRACTESPSPPCNIVVISGYCLTSFPMLPIYYPKKTSKPGYKPSAPKCVNNSMKRTSIGERNIPRLSVVFKTLRTISS